MDTLQKLFNRARKLKVNKALGIRTQEEKDLRDSKIITFSVWAVVIGSILVALWQGF